MSKPWPPNYLSEFKTRSDRIDAIKADEILRLGLAERYRNDPVSWINHWAVTYDPRHAGSEDMPTTMPFVMFPKQEEFVGFLHACVSQQVSGLIEKSRDIGATWCCCAFSVWLWLYWPGAAIGWGSRKEDLVDKIGEPDSIFEKIRIIIRHLPRFMLPAGFDISLMPFMKVINPETGSTIAGESGDNIGRGGRKLIYFKDESAHYERPEKIEAALSDNTNCQIDISSVNGLGNVFHRRRESGLEYQAGQPLAKDRANIFVFDWSDHPGKTQGWYDARRAKAEAEGMLHVFAQEVERNYSAAVAGVIIPADWVTSAIDAHIALGFEAEGGWRGALDPADEGGDLHALALGKGSILLHVEDWGEGDVGEATRRSVGVLEEHGALPIEFQYDSVGVGAGVKSEANRLKAEKREDKKTPLLPKGLKFVPWSAGSAVLDPDERVIPDDKESPLNKDFYANLKAQAWWQLRLRFERTHKAVTKGERYDPATLISLPKELAGLQKLRKELSQATRGKTGALKMLVNKTPEGTRSPNMADAVVMAFWPLPPASRYNWDA